VVGGVAALSHRARINTLVDSLGAIGSLQTYQDLLPNSTEVEVGAELKIREVNLETLIQIKEQTGRDKDRAVLPTLRATLEESRKR